MLKKESSVSYSEEPKRISLRHPKGVLGNLMFLFKQKETDFFFFNYYFFFINSNLYLEPILMFCLLVILQQLNRNCYNMYIKLLQGGFILLAKVLLLLVLQFMWQKIQKLKKLFLKVELLCFQIEVYAALMSLIRWMITAGLFFLRLWSSKPSLSLRQESYASSTLELQS